MHGTGTKTWKNGDSYHGDWREGEKDGEGTSTFGEHKGDKYVGGYRSGKKHGQGIYISDETKMQYDGNWNDNELDETNMVRMVASDDNTNAGAAVLLDGKTTNGNGNGNGNTSSSLVTPAASFDGDSRPPSGPKADGVNVSGLDRKVSLSNPFVEGGEQTQQQQQAQQQAQKESAPVRKVMVGVIRGGKKKNYKIKVELSSVENLKNVMAQQDWYPRDEPHELSYWDDDFTEYAQLTDSSIDELLEQDKLLLRVEITGEDDDVMMTPTMGRGREMSGTGLEDDQISLQ
eukprot:TRINITY_DN330_c0_g1_i10.p1 TRINITY_DN330_c0_g1~~TRINITY_DN330_c0_g1_i10.p1  ORF type:complete len:288 (+),score=110.90 TRINITY_DN330_c0_g1_i10:135-998(+)